jgi:hypothetical protein
MFSIPGTRPVVLDSLVANNSAYSGGGLRLDHGGKLVNVTVTGNRLLALPPGEFTKKPVSLVIPIVDEISGWGGGIDHRGGADVEIVNSTITGNHALKGGGGIASGQGYAPISEQVALGRMTLHNTVVAGNTSDAGTANCHVKAQVIASLGHNLASDDSCFLTAPGDVPKTDPLLGPLADNGGPTQTVALRAGSPAIDTADAAACPDHDQRGTKRPAGSGCDIGAFEYVAPSVAAPRCAFTVRLPARLRTRARRFSVRVGRKVVGRGRHGTQRVTLKLGASPGAKRRVVLRVRLRDGRLVYARTTVRALCRVSGG